MMRWLPLLLAAALAMLRLEWWPLWEDELWTWGLSFRGPGRVVDLSIMDKHPPLYFLIGAMSGKLGGHADWALRLPSALGAVAAVALTQQAARHMLDARGVFAAGMVAALSPFLLLYAGMARAYGLMAMLGAALLLASLQLVAQPKAWRWALLATLAGAAALYSHYATLAQLAAFGVGILGGSLLSGGDWRARIRPLWMGALAAGLAILAFLPWFLGPMSTQVDRQEDAARSLKVLRYLLWPIDEYTPGTHWILALLMLGGLVLALGRRTPAHGVLLGWVAMALLLPFVASSKMDAQWKTYIYIGFLPLTCVLAAASLQWLAARVSGLHQHAPKLLLVGTPLLLAAPGQHLLWALPSAPLGFALLGAGPHDAEADMALLGRVSNSFSPRSLDDRPFSPYAHYGPGAGEPFEGPPSPPAVNWRGWGRTRDYIGGNSLKPPYDRACAFEWAFSVLVYIQPEDHCMALRREILAHAEDQDRPTLWMEVAEYARYKGSLPTAEAAAMRAHQATLTSPEPALFLASLYQQTSRYDEALAIARQAEDLAVKWNARFFARDAIDAQQTALNSLGRSREADALTSRLRCAVSPVPYALCGTFAQAWFSKQ